MRIIIADDEKLVRALLKNMLMELGVTEFSIVEKSNGEELLEALRIFKPDIAFVDIKMPLLNGLDAIEQGKHYSPDTSFYILTGYGEFEYAKKAIEVKVSDYLLKPVDLTKLKNIIKEQENKLLLKAAKTNDDFNAFTLAYFYNNCINTDVKAKYQDSYFKLFYICIDRQGTCSGAVSQITQAINTLLKSYLGKNILASSINISPEYILITLSFNNKSHSNISITENFFMDLKSTLVKECTNNQKITIIETALSQGLDKYSELVQKLKHTAVLRKLAGIAKNYCLSELELVSNAVNHKLCKLIDDLLTSYSNKLYPEFVSYCGELKDFLVQHYSDKTCYQLIESVKVYLQFSIGLPSQCLNMQVESFLKSLIEYAEKNILKKYEKEDYIEATKFFIENNYMRDIGVNTIAEQLKLNPNYLSTLFHASTGKKFKKYLTDIRMLTAKKLLIETDFTVERVSRDVGYFSVSHFIRVFTEYYGCSPSYMKTKV